MTIFTIGGYHDILAAWQDLIQSTILYCEVFLEALYEAIMDSKYARIVMRIIEKIREWISHHHPGSCTDYFPKEICHGFMMVAEAILNLVYALGNLAKVVLRLAMNLIEMWR